MTPARIPLIRTSEITTWRTCPQKWWWGYREGLQGKGLPNYNFWFGTGIHLALAGHYQKGFARGTGRNDPIRIWKKYCKDEFAIMRGYDEDGTRKFFEAEALGIAMLEHYLATYGRDEHMEIMSTEEALRIPLYDVDGKLIAYYLFTMDGVYRDHNDYKKIKILEHKTATMIIIAHLVLDDQAGTYLALMTEVLRARGVLGPDEAIQDITYNFLRKEIYKPDTRPRNVDGEALNKDGTVSKQQGVQAPVLLRKDIARSAEARRTLIDRIVVEAEAMNRMRENPDLVFKNPHGGPFGCTSCPFFEMCQLHEEGGDWLDLREWKYYAEDPYANYRKAA